ncbi:MAG TPA: hypothetical protein VFL93_15940, partial [Longimicrobiaceae bacterium]|nr:hypothetical protein [Longimicrobiaceae bacterium]
MHTNATPPAAPVRDPRDFVTPDALHVAHELLGLPLAKPWRRAAAMAIDGVLVAILSNAPSVLFGLAAALVLLRVATRRRPGGGYVRHSLRLTFAFGGAILLFIVALSAWRTVARRIGEVTTASIVAAADPPRPPDEPGAAAPGGNDVTVSGVDGLRTAAAVLAFRRASDPARARTLADAVVRAGRGSGIADADIREMMNGIAAGHGSARLLRRGRGIGGGHEGGRGDVADAPRDRVPHAQRDDEE